jgi:hypothetical protein
MTADPIVQAMIEEAHLSPEALRDVENSVLSIKVIATKAA